MMVFLSRKPKRRCVAAGIDCHGDGFHELHAIETGSGTYNFVPGGPGELVTRNVVFRAPCICAAADAWVESVSRKPGRKPNDPADDYA